MNKSQINMKWPGSYQNNNNSQATQTDISTYHNLQEVNNYDYFPR